MKRPIDRLEALIVATMRKLSLLGILLCAVLFALMFAVGVTLFVIAQIHATSTVPKVNYKQVQKYMSSKPSSSNSIGSIVSGTAERRDEEVYLLAKMLNARQPDLAYQGLIQHIGAKDVGARETFREGMLEVASEAEKAGQNIAVALDNYDALFESIRADAAAEATWNSAGAYTMLSIAAFMLSTIFALTIYLALTRIEGHLYEMRRRQEPEA